MIARCARCQGTFTTDRFGVQTCPNCGSELHLADPAAAAGQPPAAPPAPAGPPPAGPPPAGASLPPLGEPAWGAPPPPPSGPAGAVEPPSPPVPPAGGWGLPPPPPFGGPPPGPPPGGWGGAPPPGSFGGAPPPGSFGAPPAYGPPGGSGGFGGYGGPGGYGPPPGGPPPGWELPAPFAERATRGFFPAFFETWKLVATRPADLFRRVRIDQSGSAVLFGVLAASVGSMAAATYGYFSAAGSLAAMQDLMANLPEEQTRFLQLFAQGVSGGATLAQIALAPLFALLGIYLTAGVLHLLLLLFKAAPRGFDATLTVVGYATGLQLLLAVPGCGGLLALVWYLVALIIGLGEAQRCGPGKAAAAVFTPVLLGCLCCCGVAGVSGAGLLEALKQGTKTVTGQGVDL
ncbi:MAG: YIP1 family protein [Anaeromyxobacter sp.]|nr:YIP1 family protein [Anaeromyxobacter sp.]MBL0277022.1 YIP1 family protein [Anaeromyxobacter sp.]